MEVDTNTKTLISRMFLDPASVYQKFFVGLIIYASLMRSVDTFAMLGKIEV